MITYDRLFIGGSWVEPSNPQLLDIASPHDQSVVGRVAQAQPADIDRAVAAARASFEAGEWRLTPPAERIATLRRFNALREQNAEKIAHLISLENGSAGWFTRAGQPGLTRQANAYLKAAEEFAWEETLQPSDPTSPVRSVVRREAIGVVAAVIPWNSPFSSATSKIIPALVAGNSVVLKVSPENSLSMGFLAELLEQVGLPEGVISVLPADRETSEYLVSHRDVDKIAFTGSTRAGRRIAAIAGEQFKRVSLELGGKSAAIILPDADIEKAVAGLKFGSLLNNGESCIAQTRILAPRSRYEEVVAALKELVESLKVGDPNDSDTFIGPMIRPDQQERVRNYIQLGIEEGARLVAGGPQIPEGLEKGNYVTPTVFADVDNSMRIAQEEIFGPVLVVIAYDDEDDAVRIANDSEYGLSGGVWSSDEEHALAVARRVRTGTITVNGASVAFDGPFGGFKASGIGREYGAVGLGTYTEYKTITV
ncbi:MULTISPECIES: aldehyde dehydrogenase [Streptomyces]|uniref:aldehyde dehydrogenase (NAD(+)) n=2 Tax=Streptomyces TaxID=1883 RepID=A0ABD5JJG0_9ACTN|nr:MULTISPECIES: aldehyde dehydrogenase [Streptomyces]MEE4588190.1 aldehyde dehydrogenase [Streptomyces sp. DSM 41602]QTI90427.1 aldehyde dehydrogenase [Streptomyces sp. AgN23]RSS46729.1 aldehyde dehydrogenase [Streptomyces sp. WAC05858]WJD94713.1 aldehyde dehydrogenase [Streptomyces antimycoticus]WTB11017.1 aldehyde dehydrogenase [Streptomyces antimycoticus]